MAITYPVDVVNTEWAIYQVDIGQVIDRRKPWPRADGGEIVGQDPNFVWLLHVDGTKPTYDARLYTLEGTEGVDVDNNVLSLTWAALERPLEEQLAAIDNEESARLSQTLDLTQEIKTLRKVLDAVIAQLIDLEALPAEAQAVVDKFKTDGNKVWQNHARANELKDDVRAGRKPDLDAGWAK